MSVKRHVAGHRFMAMTHPVFTRGFLVGIAAVAALLFTTAPFVLAQNLDPLEAMIEANRRYEVGQYREAAQIYESILAAGITDSAVYYNTGNAYFKQGDLGRAILNYRRAQQLDPRDLDISTNLQIARAQALDALEASNDGALTNFVKVAEEWLTLNEAYGVALFLWLVVCGLAIVAILLPRLRRISLWAIAVAAVLLLVGIFSIANRVYAEYATPSAVIVAEKVDVTSGPGQSDQYLVEFELHAGAEVRQLEGRNGWQRIALPGNSIQGWVAEEAIEPVSR